MIGYVQEKPRTVVALLLAVGLLVAGGASADTIHLKNGRLIRTDATRVVGDRLIFYQYGGEVAIPMSLVERVEEDQRTGPEARPTPTPGTESAETGEAEEGDTTGEDPAAGEAEGEEEVPEKQTREYWQERKRQITSRIAQLEDRLEELRREERAFLFSHRSTASTRREIQQVEAELEELQQALIDLREEARRAGVPPGWVR